MTGLEIAAVIGAVAAVGGTVASISAQKKAGRAAKRQQKNAARRSRRQAIREAQIQRARALASTQGLGAAGSSAEFGGVGSLSSQLGGKLGFQSTQSALSNIISSQQGRANTFSGIADLGMTVFQAAGGFGRIEQGLNNLSGPSPTPAPAPYVFNNASRRAY